MPQPRSRLHYALAIACVIAMGLFSRSAAASFLPAWFQDYSGDALWALNLYLVFGWLFSAWPSLRIFALTLAAAFGVEAFQLYQADWVNGIRDTRLGGLLLGFGFKWSDILLYSLGALAGLGLEKHVHGGGYAESISYNRNRESRAGDL